MPMFLYVITITAFNLRLLGIHSDPGYLFGSIGENINMVKDYKNGHQYTYRRVTNSPYFYIEVAQMPNVYWSYDSEDNTIKYEYTKSPDEKNIFYIDKKLGSYYYSIKFGDECLTYSEMSDSISLKDCNEIDGHQSFVPYCHEEGEVINDVLPMYEPPMSKELTIE